MLEIVTDALVLDTEPNGEYNSRVFLYTRELGGVVARATSLRKITSKMASHLEPLTFVRVRLIQKGDSNTYQLADALAFDRCVLWRESPDTLREGINIISIFKEPGLRGDVDAELWNILRDIFANPPQLPFHQYGTRIVSALGFDHRMAVCDVCGGKPKVFSISGLIFYCQSCQEIKAKLLKS